LKSGSLNFLEPSGPVQACNGNALPFTGCRLVVYFMPCLLYPQEKCPSYPLNRRLRVPQIRSEQFGKATSLVPAWSQTAVPQMFSP